MILSQAENRLNQLCAALRPWWMRLSLLLLGVLVTGVLAGLRVNSSRSLPLGVYRAVGDSTDVVRGSVVIVCLPEVWSRFALQRRILGSGHCPGGSYGLGKIVIAVEGDVVTVSRDQLIIAGELLVKHQVLELADFGHAIPRHPLGTYTLRPGEVWLFSCHPSAFDSRYFGPVAKGTVRSVIRPIFIEARWALRACRRPPLQVSPADP